MAVFRTASSKNKQPEYQPHHPEHNKLEGSNIHDPILTAVNEAQPFEEANQVQFTRNKSYLSQGSGELKDIFGNRIRQADVSNPTRNRNERPLDTIRAFEYAITGDMSYRDQLESDRLGWGFHEDFPYHNLNAQADDLQQAGYSRPVASFSGANQQVYQAPNYSASSLKPDAKKKRGLFGRKK
ncbi:hypothetical protein JCM33374_g1099 [Metschnikowia sp. JCM 33374]|nr:hypothetical protein JCM33374_g1099 [Metschnikowia sp. JCM 33374]